MENFITVKTVESYRYRVEFQRCYKGDLLTAENRITEKNRIQIFSKTRPELPPQIAIVSVNLGNHYFKRLLSWEDDNDGAWDHVFDSLFLDVAASNNDYDFYSDLYKDTHGVRPHYTQSQWDEVVLKAKSLN